MTGPLPEYLHGGPRNTRRRSRVLIALLVLVCVYEIGLEISAVKHLSRPSTGFRYVHMGLEREVKAEPLTAAAEAAVKGMRAPFTLLRVNGKELKAEPQWRFVMGTEHFLATAHGEKNRFLVRDRRGATRELSVPVEYPVMRVAIRYTYPGLLSKAVGLFYFFIALLVWWLRPEDRAAGPLLLLGMVAFVNLSQPLALSAAMVPVLALGLAGLPLWGLAGVHLAIHFVGATGQPLIRRAFKVLTAVILFTSVVLFVSVPAAMAGNSYGALMLDFALLTTGLEMVSCVLFIGPLAWSVTRSGNHQALRQRGRFFAAASGISFLIPSVVMLLSGAGVRIENFPLLVLFFLAFFPALMGYAIVRHSMFDLRRVIRRGAVYAALTLMVSLGYVAVVLLGLHIAASRSPSPVFMGFSVAMMMLVFGLLQVRVLKAVDRLVYRTRYVYAEALRRASEALSRERNLEGIRQTVRGALVDAMGLSRVYLAVWEDEEVGRLRCHHIGGQGDRRTRAAHPFPGRLEVVKYAPLARAFRSRLLATTHDSTAVSAQSAPPTTETLMGRPGSSEASFWSWHGIEAVIPLTTGRGGTWPRVVGFLLLGPKRADLCLDPEDHEMLATLAHQISVAVEHVESLEEIQRLNEGLERQVQERTRELSDALQELKETQQQLIEAGMQSAVGRLVAALLHEVNTPLGTLLSSVDMVDRVLVRVGKVLARQDDDPDPDMRRARRSLQESDRLMAVLGESVQRISEVLDSLRRFVSLDEAEVRSLDLERSVRDAVNLLAPSLTDKIKVEVRFPEDEISVMCYPARLNRVFLNLLSNAADAIDGEGAIQVTAELHGERVTVAVRDTGRGIPEARQGQLFDLGFTTKADGRVGMRLGLPSSKRWVEELGGTLEIDSEEGKGTNVQVKLPLAPELN